MIQREQVRLYQMILAGMHAFFGGFGVLIGLLGLIFPLGFVALFAYHLFQSFKYALMDGYLSYWVQDFAGQLVVTVVVAGVLLLPALVALVTGSIGMVTAYGLYARKPWVKFVAIAAAIDCILILGNPLFGLIALLGIAMAVFTLMLTWGADGSAELNDGPPGLGTGAAPTPVAGRSTPPGGN